MTDRLARGKPFLPRTFTRGKVVYADPGGAAAGHREPVATFTGEVLPEGAGDLDSHTVLELAGEIGDPTVIGSGR